MEPQEIVGYLNETIISEPYPHECGWKIYEVLETTKDHVPIQNDMVYEYICYCPGHKKITYEDFMLDGNSMSHITNKTETQIISNSYCS